jgi:hypothetical protein
MWPGFWKGGLASLAAYAAAVGLGIAAGLWITLAVIPVFQCVWTVFCGLRMLQLRRERLRNECDRESYGFAVGGLVWSFVLLASAVVASQAITA